MKIEIVIMLILSVVFIPTVQADTPVEIGFECPHIVYVGDEFEVKVWLDPHGQNVDAWVLGEIRYNLLSATDVSIVTPWRKSYSSPGEIQNSAVYDFQGRVIDTQAFVLEEVNDKTEIASITCIARATGRCNLKLKSVEVAFRGELYDDILVNDIIDIKPQSSDNGNYNETDNFPPIAKIREMNTSYCDCEPIDFQSTSYDMDGFIDEYHWDFGDGLTSVLRSPSHSFIPGDYTVTLTVTDDSGASDSTSININIYDTTSNVNDTTNNNDQNDTGDQGDNDTNGNTTDGNQTREEFDYTYVIIVSAVLVGVVIFYYIGKRYWW